MSRAQMGPLLVVTSCTADKAVDVPGLALDDFRDPTRRAQRERELQPYCRPAAKMYTGQQHLEVRGGVEQLRRRYGDDAVALKIVSAGYGVIDEHRVIAPYDLSFNTMSRRQAREWARHLAIADGFRQILKGSPLGIVLLGERYLDTVEPPVAAEPAQRLAFFAKPGLARRLRSDRTTVVPAGEDERRQCGCSMIALKGRMFRLLAAALVDRRSLWDDLLGDETGQVFLAAIERGSRLA